MENKGAEGVQKAALEKEATFMEGSQALVRENESMRKELEMQKAGGEDCCGRRRRVGEQATSVESTKDPFRRLKDAPMVLKSKARAAGEYAALKTRQGISMFGEPKIGAIKTIVDNC